MRDAQKALYGWFDKAWVNEVAFMNILFSYSFRPSASKASLNQLFSFLTRSNIVPQPMWE